MAQPRRFQFSLKALILAATLLGAVVGLWWDARYNLHLTELGRFPLTIDYSRSIEDGIVAGKYDWHNPDITSANFPMESGKSGKLAREAIILQIDRYTTTEEILQRMDGRGYEPATPQELLSFGETYPDYQRQEWVIALGFSWRGPHGLSYVVVLDCNADSRFAYLGLRQRGWGRRYRFLAFAK